MMYTVKMNPANPVATRARRVTGLFDDPFFRSVMGMEPARRPMGMRVDVREKADAYILEAELPGVALEDITLTVENDVLTIAADVNRRNREEHEGCVISERRSGHVERRFQLEGVDQDAITANSVNGVLTVTLPKVKPEGAKVLRHIAISAAKPSPALPEAEAAHAETPVEA